MTAEPFDATEISPILAYGYDLGAPGRWNFPPENLQSWDGEEEFRDWAGNQLDAHRRDPGVDLTAVDVWWYGDATRTDAPIGYILSATTYCQHYLRALTLPLDLPRGHSWDRRLSHALDVLGLNLQGPAAGPRWILAAARGVHD